MQTEKHDFRLNMMVRIDRGSGSGLADKRKMRFHFTSIAKSRIWHYKGESRAIYSSYTPEVVLRSRCFNEFNLQEPFFHVLNRSTHLGCRSNIFRLLDISPAGANYCRKNLGYLLCARFSTSPPLLDSLPHDSILYSNSLICRKSV